MAIDNSSHNRQLIENEKYFRQLNERVQKGIDELNRIAIEEHSGGAIDESNTELYFFCECSDRECRERVKLTLGGYNKIHEDRKQFVIKSGHESKSVEQVVNELKCYSIVRKYKA